MWRANMEAVSRVTKGRVPNKLNKMKLLVLGDL